MVGRLFTGSKDACTGIEICAGLRALIVLQADRPKRVMTKLTFREGG